MKCNKWIGILEMGQASTQFYIKLLNEMYRKEHTSQLQFFKLIPTDFEAINNLLPNRSDKLDTKIAGSLREMIMYDIHCVLIPNITIHETVDAVWDLLDTTMPIAHPLSGTIKRMRKAHWNKAVLFGSKFTMTSDYVRSVFANADIAIAQPEPEDIEIIDRVRREVYSENASAEILEQFNDLVKTYSNEMPVLIACTELSIAINSVNENILDMARIQVEDAISIIDNLSILNEEN